MKAIVRQTFIYEIDGLTEEEIDAAVDGHDLDLRFQFPIVDEFRGGGNDAYEESCEVIGVKP